MKKKSTIKLASKALLVIFAMLAFVPRADAQQVRLNLDLKDVTVKEFVARVAEQTKYKFVFSDALKELDNKVSVTAKNENLDAVLTRVLTNQGIVYKIQDMQILLSSKALINKVSNIEVKGVVTDETLAEPLPGAAIQVKGENIYAVTDINGRYTITAPENATLIISSIGMQSKEVAINKRIEINVGLQLEEEFLEAAVVVAYGEMKREAITGAVSSISTQDIEKRTLSSVSGAIEGSSPGIIATTSGAPGSAPDIRIRGFTSISGSNAPLYIVDGVPLAGNIADYNSNDVESITVLKDAASAALYGNRASNGVILITTKRGKSTTPTFRLSINQGIYSKAIPEHEKMNAYEFMEANWQGLYWSLVNDPSSAYYSDHTGLNQYTGDHALDYLVYNIFNVADSELFLENGKLNPNAKIRPQYNDLDWMDAVIGTGHRQEYFFSADGRSDKSNYYISAGYLDEKGYLDDDRLKRYSGRTNVTLTPKSWFKMGLIANGSYQESDNVATDSNTGYINPVYYARYMSPIYPIYLHDMATGDYILDDDGNKQYDDGSLHVRPQNGGRHVIWERELNSDKTYRTTLNANLWVTITFLKDFNFTVKGDASLRNTESRYYRNAVLGDAKGAGGGTSGTFYKYLTITGQQLLTWDRYFDRHHVDVLLSHENYDYSYKYNYAYKVKEAYPGGVEFTNFSELSSISGYESGYKMESYLGRVRYSYDNKYFFDASIRSDGSSRFHPDSRWGTFWSVGGSWSIHRENFMGNIQAIDALKLRVSYGQVGNDRGVDYYEWQDLYSNTVNGGLPASYKNQNGGGKALTWESANSFGVAVEARLWNRVNITDEYFDKTSKDILFNLDNPLSTGSISTSSMGATRWINSGNISNRGVELSADVDVIKVRDWTWNISANATIMKNKITKLPTEMIDYVSGSRKYSIGHSIYEWWVYQFAGVDQMTGKSLYYIDEEEYDPTGQDSNRGKVTSEHLVQIGDKYYTTHYSYVKKDWSGSALPDVYGSFGTNFSYKNLSFTALFTYSIGGKMYDSNYNSLMSVGTTPSAIHRDYLKAWNGVPDGMTDNSPNRIDPDGIPAIDYYMNSYKTVMASNFLHSRSYLSVKNISVSYMLPQRWANAIDLSSISVRAGVENLWTFTAKKGLNPQYSFGGTTANDYDGARIVSLAIDIKF